MLGFAKKRMVARRVEMELCKSHFVVQQNCQQGIEGSKSPLLGSGGGNIGCSSAIELSMRWRQGVVQWEGLMGIQFYLRLFL